MSQSVWGYWLITLGIGVITVMMLVQNYTTINQEDYYMLKEVTQASMYDAIDFNHYRQYGELKIHREKFVENFIRRFSESIKANKNYKIDFYDIYETPPKVSVKVSTKTSSFNVSGDIMDLDVTNSIDAILENNGKNSITKVFYSVPYAPCPSPESEQDALGYCKVENSPTLNSAGIKSAIIKELQNKGIYIHEDDLKIVKSNYIGQMTTETEYDAYYDQFLETYGIAYDSVRARAPKYSEVGGISDLIANEITDMKLTVTNNNVLAWSGKFKCESGHGFPDGYKELNADGHGGYGNSIEGSCLIGIKYELTFEY